MLSRRPIVSLLVAFTCAGFGVVLARRAAGPLPAAPTSPKPSGDKVDSKPKRSPGWRSQVNLKRALPTAVGLVQRLRDGTRITYALDPKLQRHAKSILKSYTLPYAGLVLFDLRTGDVLVMAGHSENSPEMGSSQLCLTPWAPAASVFKLVTVAALLNKHVSPATTVCYHGGRRRLRAEHLRDNPKRDKTCRTLSQALARSINPVIAKLAVRHLNPTTLNDWVRRFAFNRRLRFDLPTQPSRATIPGDNLEFARTAAGFWNTELSVLHGAVIAAVVANGGVLRWPRLVRSIRHPSGKTTRPAPQVERRVMRRKSAQELNKMMVATTRQGSGRRGFFSRRGRPFLPNISVAGKTGSLARSDPYLEYSWFVGFAPADAPKVAFAALLGNPPRWRIKASTAARMLLAEYFRGRAQSTTAGLGQGSPPGSRSGS